MAFWIRSGRDGGDKPFHMFAGGTIRGSIGSCAARTSVQGNVRGPLPSLTLLQRGTLCGGSTLGPAGSDSAQKREDRGGSGGRSRNAVFIWTTAKFQRWRFAPPLVTFPSRCLAEESEGGGGGSRCRYRRAQLSSKSRCLAPTALSSGLSPVSASLSTAHSSSFTPFWQSPGPF